DAAHDLPEPAFPVPPPPAAGCTLPAGRLRGRCAPGALDATRGTTARRAGARALALARLHRRACRRRVRAAVPPREESVLPRRGPGVHPGSRLGGRMDVLA